MSTAPEDPYETVAQIGNSTPGMKQFVYGITASTVDFQVTEKLIVAMLFGVKVLLELGVDDAELLVAVRKVREADRKAREARRKAREAREARDG